MAIVCPICEGDGSVEFKLSKKVGKEREDSFYYCSECDFMFFYPVQSYKDRNEFYDRIGQEMYVRKYRLDGDFSQGAKEIQYSRLHWVVAFKPSGRLLELGCSTGCFLQVARDEGFEVAGVDLSAPSATYARERLGLEVTTGAIHDAAYPAESFDVVYSWHTLEHIWNPNEVIDEIRRILKPGGIVLLGVPNGACLAIRTLGSRYPHVHHDHLLYFSPRSMARMLTKHGFTLQRLWTSGWDKLSLFRGLGLVWRKHPPRNRQEHIEYSSVFASNWTRARMLPIRLPLAILNPLVEKLGLGDNPVCIATK